MFKILFADDSSFDRLLVTSILEKSPDYQVTSVNNGRDALKALACMKFDLLITDLNMPEVDGLTLISEVRDGYPELLTIVITAYGSEATAMRALQSGAYSYVPKFHLQDELITTVETVLRVTACRRQEEDLLCSIAQHSITLSLPSQRDRITPTIDYLQKLMTAMNLFGKSEAMHLGVALEEALSNAIIHGNLEVSSKLRERSDNSYAELIELRSAAPPYSDRRVTIEVCLDAQSAEFVIRDEGPGFDRSALPDPHDPENLLRSSGRGITLMHAFLDEVTYNKKGNEVTLRMNVPQEVTCENSDASLAEAAC